MIKVSDKFEDFRTNSLEILFYIIGLVLFFDVSNILFNKSNAIELMQSLEITDIYWVLLFFIYFYVVKFVRTILTTFWDFFDINKGRLYTNYYTLAELKKSAMKENNQTKYNIYLLHRKENLRRNNIKDLVMASLILYIAELFISTSIIGISIEYHKGLIFVYWLVAILLFLWAMQPNSKDSDFTYIQKKKLHKTIKNRLNN